MTRSTRRRVRAVAMAAGVVAPLLAACGPPPPLPVTVTDIGDLGGGSTRPSDIDDGGRVVGASATDGGGDQPFVWEDGAITALPGLPAGGVANAVDGDLIAGTVGDGTGATPVVWDDGALTTIADAAPGTSSRAVVDRTVLLGYRFPYGTQAILWEDGATSQPPLLPGGAMDAGDVNASGQVVGRSTRYPTEPYLWSEAEGLVPLGTLGGASGESVAVNDAGQVAGWSQVDTSTNRAFLWQDGAMTDLGALHPGGGSTVAGARSLSEAGHVVGTADTASGATHAVLWHEGTTTDLGTLGGADSRPVAVNSHGQVIGVSDLAGGGEAVFLWDDGRMTNLTALAAGVTVPVDINDAGQAVGYDPTGGRAVVFTAPTG